MLTQSYLKSILRYNKAKGIFTWKKGARAGMRAGSYRKAGRYRSIYIDGKNYQEHRLAYLYITGKIPPVVDHINNICDDNRWSNLRGCSLRENSRNTSLYKNNQLGIKGVYFCRHKKRYIASITVKGKRKYLGSFTSVKAAQKARREVAKQIFGEFFNG